MFDAVAVAVSAAVAVAAVAAAVAATAACCCLLLLVVLRVAVAVDIVVVVVVVKACSLYSHARPLGTLTRVTARNPGRKSVSQLPRKFCQHCTKSGCIGHNSVRRVGPPCFSSGAYHSS